MEITSNPLIGRLKSTGNLKGGVALDIGAGNGNDAVFLKKNGYIVTALEKNLEVLKENTDASDIEIIEGDIIEIDLGKEKYDLILANNVLPFIQKDLVDVTLDKIVNSLKPEGVFCFSLFGKEDEWSNRETMSFFTFEESLKILSTLPVEIFFQSTEKGYGPTKKGSVKFWEIHKFIVRKK